MGSPAALLVLLLQEIACRLRPAAPDAAGTAPQAGCRSSTIQSQVSSKAAVCSVASSASNCAALAPSSARRGSQLPARCRGNAVQNLQAARPASNRFCVPVAGGEISFLQDAEATLSNIYKRPVQLDPTFVSRKQPVPPRVFLARMLNNLKQVGTGGCRSITVSACPPPAGNTDAWGAAHQK